MQIDGNTGFLARRGGFALTMFMGLCAFPVWAQESPYIVTYDHHLEEPGNLEVEYFSTFGTQRTSNDFHAFWVELEYGVKAWWTSEFYLDGQTTLNDSTVFTAFAGKTAFVPCVTNTLSTRCFTSSTRTPLKRTRLSRKWKATTSSPILPIRYLAPAVEWNLPSGWTLRLSPGFGLNDNSHRLLLRRESFLDLEG